MTTKLARYYSEILGRKVSPSQVITLLNAQAAFVFAVFPADMSFVLRAVGVLWLASAMHSCRHLLHD